jgi:hypothetical protein
VICEVNDDVKADGLRAQADKHFAESPKIIQVTFKYPKTDQDMGNRRRWVPWWCLHTRITRKVVPTFNFSSFQLNDEGVPLPKTMIPDAVFRELSGW